MTITDSNISTDKPEVALQPVNENNEDATSIFSDLYSEVASSIHTFRNDYLNCAPPSNYLDPSYFEGVHEMGAHDASVKEHQLRDDCGKVKMCEIHPHKLVYKEVECNKVNEECEAHFDNFTGPFGSFCSFSNHKLTTPVFEMAEDPCAGLTADKLRAIYQEINMALQKYKDDKNKPAPGINIVLNNEVNASSSNNISNNASQTQNAGAIAAPVAPVAAPGQQAMPAPSPTAIGSAILDPDEVLNCNEEKLGFQLDFELKVDGEYKREITTVNAGTWAEKKELKKGDAVIMIDGEDAGAMAVGKLVELLKNKRPLKLGIKKKVEVPMSF